MTLTKQEKINLLINHPCITWKGSDLDAENLIIDLMMSQCPATKQIKKKPKYERKKIDSEALDKCWTAPHIKALMSKIETEVKYTKLAETRKELQKNMNETMKLAMVEVIKEFAEVEKDKPAKKAHNVFKNAKPCEITSDTDTEPTEKRRVKMFDPNAENEEKKETLADLKKKAKDMGIKKISQMNKEQLKEAIANFKPDQQDDSESRLKLLKIVDAGSNKMKLSDLKKKAKELGIKNYSKMNKSTLEEKIAEVESQADSKDTEAVGYPEVKENEPNDEGLEQLDEIGTTVNEIEKMSETSDNEEETTEDFVNGDGEGDYDDDDQNDGSDLVDNLEEETYD